MIRPPPRFKGPDGRPDAVIFQRLDQAGFRVAWRRFGEVLLAANFGQVDRIALVEFGQAVVLFRLARPGRP